MPATSWLPSLVEGLLDLVFAPVCVACGAAIPTSETARVVCRLCRSRARPLPAPHCRRCWTPLPPGAAAAACAVCAELPPGVRALRSAFVMAAPASEMVYALKYRGWRIAAEPMAELMRALPLPDDVVDEAHTVVPVPVSAARLRERGYNQAELLAGAYARATQRQARPEWLVRTRSTESQTALHPDERRANVAHAFVVPRPYAAELQREHLLLVDDVWTTGATALACAEALLDAGARAVSVLTFARALPMLTRREAASDRAAAN